MTKDEFKVDFKRLCDGFSYAPKPTQLEAFYERLQCCHPDDWREAVTDLLCAPKFPYNLEAILSAVEIRAEQRRRSASYQARQQTHSLSKGIQSSISMREALAERPELLASIERLLKTT